MRGGRLGAVAALCLLSAIMPAHAQEPSPEIPSTSDKPLTSAQTELIELMSVLQVAAAACTLKVDTAVLGLTARQEGLRLNSEPEKKVIAGAMADARARFSGQKRGVLSILDEYGPRGTRLQGLLSKP